jgi:hypothetical protein
LEALHVISIRPYSYFDLTLLNVILLFILLSIAIIIGLIAIKLFFLSSHLHRRERRTHRNNNGTLYRLQGPTETQLPLLDHGPGEQSLTTSLIGSGTYRLTQNENVNHSIDDDDEQHQVSYEDNRTDGALQKKRS